jgi:beta-glucosidase/6-phospho-beta-glucosidase/beta-galactosidase
LKNFDEYLGDIIPPDFKWGAGISAYQTEGAREKEGRGKSIWDNFERGKKIIPK